MCFLNAFDGYYLMYQGVDYGTTGDFDVQHTRE
jgi:hypothetical protein